jgi:RHS repeat-associated protein
VESSTSAVIAVHAIHSDHLNTPRALANAQTQGGQPAGTVVWRWKLNQQTATGSNAFGAQPAEEDPDGNWTSVRFDLRFPGQQYDAATGLYYNYFRDYEPGTGRYVESDPVGLKGGVSTYAYVSSNPLGYSDASGLCCDAPSNDARYFVQCASSYIGLVWCIKYTPKCGVMLPTETFWVFWTIRRDWIFISPIWSCDEFYNMFPSWSGVPTA